MQPYQEAAEETRRQGELPLNIAKGIGSAGAAIGSAYLAGGAVNRVLPFLSKYIPEDLAIKGLTKIDPRYGKFIQKALSAGQSFEEVKDFIGGKIEEGQPAKESRNIIEQESPELHQFISDQIKSGRKPLEAAALAQVDKSKGQTFKQVIEKLKKSHKTSWADIIESIYGNGEMALPQQQTQPIQQPQQQAQTQQPQQGGADAKQQLMQAMQALSQQLRS